MKSKKPKKPKKTLNARQRIMPPPAHVSAAEDPGAFDPARDTPQPRLTRNTSDDPKGEKLLAKIARIPPAADVEIGLEREFSHVILRVEERFRDVLDDEARAKLGAADDNGKYEPSQISTGWWVVLDGWPVAMRFGSGKPDIEPGDTLVLVARVVKDDAP